MAHSLALAFGILGNILSILMFLAPIPTFFGVYRKKSTEGFQSIPYVIALLNSMLWVYYAMLKSTDVLLLSTNSIGCFVECIYVLLFIIYAPKAAKILTLYLVAVLNMVGFFSILLLTHFFAEGSNRLYIVGWCCVVMSTALFAAPLSIMRVVIRTKSVEFMPFTLSLFLVLSAIMWLLYGTLQRDFFVTLPNGLGVLFGVLQMVLYAIYRGGKKVIIIDPSQNGQDPVIKITTPEVIIHKSVSLLPIICKDENQLEGNKQEKELHHDDQLQRKLPKNDEEEDYSSLQAVTN